MRFKRLLAKSTSDDTAPHRGESLQGHTAEVISAVEQLIDVRGVASLRALALPADWHERLRRIGFLAALTHDLGKCSLHFQQMVRNQRKAQLIRHEAASLWLCWPGQPLAQWLRPLVDSDCDYLIALLAAAGHHRKFFASAFAPEGAGAGSEVELLTSHPDFGATLKLGAKRASCPAPTLPNVIVSDSALASNSPRKAFPFWQAHAMKVVPPRSEEAKLLALLKALLLCGDVAGSVLPRGNARATWLRELLADEDVGPALHAVVSRRLGGRSKRVFQTEVEKSRAPVSLVTAGCGSGKTVAAIAWAATQHPGRRLWLTYPTTGTATEGFRDYMNPSDVNARLTHGRAEVDVEIFGLRDGDDRQRDVDRLDALREWGDDAITCTVDTVLGLIQNNRRGMYAWPNIVQGAVVFDEIHAYDDKLFGALLRFLEAMPGVPALLMTASLPAHRLAALQRVVSNSHDTALALIAGPTDLETLPRYRLHDERGQEAALGLLREQASAAGKVLWVSNTVDRCVAAARSSEAVGRPRIYHSRFRYIDRVDRHRDVIDAFSPTNACFEVACTTQVAEMSLDLSADLLITDLAPIPAMIQRLGRLNRRSSPEAPAPIKRVVVIEPNHHLPYTRAELDEARRWLQALQGRDLSQRDLVEAWEQSDEKQVVECPSAWLDGGFSTNTEPLREAGDGITVMLPCDVARVRAGDTTRVKVALPMNRPPVDWRSWDAPFHLPVPPEGRITYDCHEGAKWVK